MGLKDELMESLRERKPKDDSTGELLHCADQILADIHKRNSIIERFCEKIGIKKEELKGWINDPRNFTPTQRKLIEHSREEINKHRKELHLPDLEQETLKKKHRKKSHKDKWISM